MLLGVLSGLCVYGDAACDGQQSQNHDGFDGKRIGAAGTSLGFGATGKTIILALSRLFCCPQRQKASLVFIYTLSDYFVWSQ